jgi:prepilin signal peptidase PulO-like enzyme (type II secretory pathway)
MTTSVTLGLLIVFSLDGSSSVTSTAQHTINPVADIVLGALVLVIAFVVATGRDTRRRARSERKRAAKADKGPPRWKHALGRGGARTTFAIGAVLTLPGASYLLALSATAKEDLSDVATVLTVVGINVIMLGPSP